MKFDAAIGLVGEVVGCEQMEGTGFNLDRIFDCAPGIAVTEVVGCKGNAEVL